MKTSKISLLILSFFTFAAFLTAHQPSGMVQFVKSFMQTLTIDNGSSMSQASGSVQDPYNLLTFAIISCAIISGFVFIGIFHLNRRRKIMAVKKAELTRKGIGPGRSEKDFKGGGMNQQEMINYRSSHTQLRAS